MSDIELLNVESDRRGEFINAWEISFARQLDAKIYDWIFDDKNIIYAALINNEIVAGYCLYPFESILNGKVKNALLCNNVFVHPQHQGKYLFVKLGKLALQDAGKKGYGDLAFGIPNKLALPGHQRVGWGIQPTIKFLSKERLILRNFISYNWLHGSLSAEQRDDIERCSRESAQDRSLSIIKTADFVRWRFESKPGVNYWFGLKYSGTILLAYCVCKYYEQGKVLHFIDIDGIDDTSVNQLIIEAESINDEFDRLNVWGSSAKKINFENLGYDLDGTEDNLIFIHPESLTKVNFSNNFNISLSDNDVY